jgi:spore coat protein U-like protein
MKKLSLVSLALVLTLAMAGMSFGATAAGTLNVSATVVPTCSVSTTPVNFGNYDGSYIYTFGDVTVTCAQGTSYHIALDAGQAPDGSGYRRMSNGTNYLLYALGNINVPGVNWGDADYANTYPYGMSYPDTGNGVAQAHSVTAELVPGQNVPTGPYSDVVNVTVYY